MAAYVYVIDSTQIVSILHRKLEGFCGHSEMQWVTRPF